VREVIEFFGSKVGLAAALGVTKAAVSQWLTEGLPPQRAIEIEKITCGKIKAIDIVGKTYVDR
jgi:DNA-binding transcriptional regulator YdaS (Cro superfamily)